MSYLKLPEECWEMIFASIESSSDFESLSLSSKGFLHISNLLRRTARAFSLASVDYILSRFKGLEHIELNSLSHRDLGSAISSLANYSHLPFLKSLSLRGVRFLPHAEIRQLGASAPRLSSLDCSQFEALTDQDVAVVTESFPFLRQLNLGNPRLSFLEVFTDLAVQSIANNCNGLLGLDISKNRNVSDTAMEALCTGCQGLISLSVSNCPAITPRALVRIASRCRRLEELLAAGVTNISSSTNLIRNLVANNTLVSLDLSQMSISTEMYDVLGTSTIPFKKLALAGWQSVSSIVKLLKMQCCSQLTHLQIRAVAITDRDFLLVLNNLRNLKVITLSCCTYLTDLSLFGIMLMCKKIVAIEMEHTAIGSLSTDAEHMLRNLKSSPSLKRLLIGKNNRFSDMALKLIANVCPNLESVDVSHCKLISDIGIVEIGKKCLKLYHLNIEGCHKVGSLGFLNLELGLPELFPRLRTLKAGRSGLNDEAAVMMAVDCKLLEWVGLERTMVSTAGLLELLKRGHRLKGILNNNGLVAPLRSPLGTGRNMNVVIG